MITCCTSCKSTRLFQFSANADASHRTVTPQDMPVICRDCNQVTVNSQPIEPVDYAERKPEDLSAAATAAGQAARGDLLAGTVELRIEQYFAKVYREAYLDGFLRCMAFYRQNAREGRIKRLRELWQTLAKEAALTQLSADSAVFQEFNGLLTLGTLGPVPH